MATQVSNWFPIGNLLMVGLGVRRDQPPNTLQPPLVDGIHLRWAFDKQRPPFGFPWYGFYLFRRMHREGSQECLEKYLKGLSTGYWSSPSFSFPHGFITSDRTIFLTEDFGPAGSAEIDLDHRSYSICRLNEPVRKISVTLGFREHARIELVGLWNDVSILREVVEGQAGEIVTVVLEADVIAAVSFGHGPVALVDFCYILVSQDARVGWELVPDFPYPMRLPVMQQDYPCTQGLAENLQAARLFARDRVRYGSPNQYFAVPTVLDDTGSVSVVNGSLIVVGNGTSWDERLTGATFEIAGDQTAYTVINVIEPTKLILSRGYGGSTSNNTAYRIYEDSFAQLHDSLVQLVAGGSAAGNMADRYLAGVAYSIGHVTVAQGTHTVTGYGTQWGDELEGLSFSVTGDSQIYTIEQVVSPTELTLDRAYIGETSNLPPFYSYSIFAPLHPKETREATPRMPNLHPLDLVLLGALHPALAQMLGLYWVDQRAESGVAYDYLIMAAHINLGNGNAALNWLRSLERFTTSVDGFIVFNKRLEEARPLNPPEYPRVYALPGEYIPQPGKPPLDAQNNAGLRWELTQRGLALLTHDPVMYHLWRADLGNLDPAMADKLIPERYKLVTEEGPILVTKPLLQPGAQQERPSDWPPFPLHAIDRALPDGWYSYRINGIDIFGRHSRNSAPAEWEQWSPAPKPKPWYYKGASGDAVIHPFAVHLLDKIPPPPPTGIEAYALDPDDPMLVKDDAYKTWRNSLSVAERDSLVGLRVRWLWTPAHIQQGYDTREFRVYFHSGRLNALLGKTFSVNYTNETECEVQTDIANNQSAGSFAGATLQIGQDSFAVLDNPATSPLRLTVRTGIRYSSGTIDVNNGADTVRGNNTLWVKSFTGSVLKIDGDQADYTILKVDPATQELTLNRTYQGLTETNQAYTITGKKQPRTNALCTVSLQAYAKGKISIDKGSTTVTGDDTGWSQLLSEGSLLIPGSNEPITIAEVVSPTRLTLDRPYTGESAKGQVYAILPHPLAVDYTAATNWEQRIAVVDYDQHVEEIIRPALGADGKELSGNSATVVGSVVSLGADPINLPNLSGIPAGTGTIFQAKLYLESDTGRPSRIYDILAVDDQAKTITVDGPPNLSSAQPRWWIGLPVRRYEIFLPAPNNPGDHFTPSLAEPIRYAHIGITAVDDKVHTLDDPKRTGTPWGGRFGNESKVGSPAAIVRVLREAPSAPELPPDSEKVFASPADYHGHSYYTYRWIPKDYLKLHVFRALDDTLFNTDWLVRTTRNALDPGNQQHQMCFPTEWAGGRKLNAAKELNAIASPADYAALSTDARAVMARLPGNAGYTWNHGLQDRDWTIRRTRGAITEADTEYYPTEWRESPPNDPDVVAKLLKRQDIAAKLNSIAKRSDYSTLLNDALRVLSGLPGNESAFSQITIQPLDPKDPVTTNRRGPDDPDDFQLDTPNKPLTSTSLRAYTATLDGRSTNCYFYRSAYIDDAQNRSPLSLSSPPIWMPDVVPPRAPVFTKVLGGDREIIIRWASNREPDLAEYRVYRARTEEISRDLRLMDLVYTESVPMNVPSEKRPEELSWIDKPVPGLTSFYYKLVAVDETGNTSQPSSVMMARAYDLSSPEQPIWKAANWIKFDAFGDIHPWIEIIRNYRAAVLLQWQTKQSGVKCLVQRKLKHGDYWISISAWLVASQGDSSSQEWHWSFHDMAVTEADDYVYRLELVNASGKIIVSTNVEASGR